MKVESGHEGLEKNDINVESYNARFKLYDMEIELMVGFELYIKYL